VILTKYHLTVEEEGRESMRRIDELRAMDVPEGRQVCLSCERREEK
jgi:hypothetical protein